MRFASIPLFVALMAGAANAQSAITSADPQTVIDQLKTMGYRASYEPYESGRPRVLTGIAGVNTSIAFYGCLDDMTNCKTLMFTSGMDMPEGSSWSTINNWNQSRIYTRAFLDENNDPYFVMPIARGQDMSAEDFSRLMNIWEDAVIDFTDEIGFER
ncbi:MAG: hypothetical protein CSA74_06530 [Rhodobacterales bacterium]|nr:MAG: hypothetical protein CSA74_06530 [Rhodobacterales bacterium]